MRVIHLPWADAGQVVVVLAVVAGTVRLESGAVYLEIVLESVLEVAVAVEVEVVAVVLTVAELQVVVSLVVLFEPHYSVPAVVVVAVADYSLLAFVNSYPAEAVPLRLSQVQRRAQLGPVSPLEVLLLGAEQLPWLPFAEALEAAAVAGTSAILDNEELHVQILYTLGTVPLLAGQVLVPT